MTEVFFFTSCFKKKNIKVFHLHLKFLCSDINLILFFPENISHSMPHKQKLSNHIVRSIYPLAEKQHKFLLFVFFFVCSLSFISSFFFWELRVHKKKTRKKSAMRLALAHSEINNFVCDFFFHVPIYIIIFLLILIGV